MKTGMQTIDMNESVDSIILDARRMRAKLTKLSDDMDRKIVMPEVGDVKSRVHLAPLKAAGLELRALSLRRRMANEIDVTPKKAKALPAKS